MNFLKKVGQFIKKEPVMAFQIIKATIAVLASFGIALTAGQEEAIKDLGWVAIAIMAGDQALGPVLRSKVTPYNPEDAAKEAVEDILDRF